MALSVECADIKIIKCSDKVWTGVQLSSVFPIKSKNQLCKHAYQIYY